VSTPDGAKNALLLAAGLVVFTTIINMVGVKTMARINNFGVAAELVGVSLLIILLAAHIRRSPAVIFDTFGLGATYPWGYFGAFLVAGLMSAYVMYGFDTAGSLAEETLDPRKNAPPGILRALIAAGVAGFLVILFGEMSVPNIHAKDSAPPGCRTWSRRRSAAHRQRVPDRLAHRDHRVQPGGARRRHPDDLHDGP
jgi:Amino acid transporters